MADNGKQALRSTYNVQNPTVSRVSGSEKSADAAENRNWVFDSRTFLAHYRHLKSANDEGEPLASAAGCRFCSGGIQALFIPDERARVAVGVPDGAGADEEKDAALAPRGDSAWGYDDSEGAGS